MMIIENELFRNEMRTNPYFTWCYELDDTKEVSDPSSWQKFNPNLEKTVASVSDMMKGKFEFIKEENLITCHETTAREKADAMVKKIIFNPPATIIFFADGEKEVVKCQNGEPFDEEKGLAMALIKHLVKLPVFNKMLEGAERR